MTRHVPISEFKDHASELIAAAERGEEIIITRHGKAAARLEAMRADNDEARRRQKAKKAMANLLAHREKMRVNGQTTTIDELIAWKNEGQK